ncbi:hypothetical protein NtRootC7_34340 [Arthrobacter sp. NtRootC7]|nr:hypothetical protein NtRootC7_34340 [Arthrobacter sp. NtRootC7]
MYVIVGPSEEGLGSIFPSLAAALLLGLSFRFVEFRFCFMKSLGKVGVRVKGVGGEVGVWDTRDASGGRRSRREVIGGEMQKARYPWSL